MSKTHKGNRKSFVTAKLIFYDWGWRENVIYRVKASCNDKKKGFLMIEAIRNYFGINNIDVGEEEEIRIKREVRAVNQAKPFKWTRDEKGKLISPYSKKLKEDFK
jgi:hypothetical protein